MRGRRKGKDGVPNQNGPELKTRSTSKSPVKRSYNHFDRQPSGGYCQWVLNDAAKCRVA